MEGSSSVISEITAAVGAFAENLATVAGDILPVAGAGLIVWVGWRLACKLLNRGVGK